MLTIYLFCLAVGGGFLAFSLLGGVLDGAEGLEADLEAAPDVGEIGGPSGWAQVFSLRSLVYGLFGFGATGSLLHLLGVAGVRPGLTLGVAAATGTGLGALVSAVFGYMRRTEAGTLQAERSFIGLLGEVTLEIGSGSPGTALVRRAGRRVRIRARMEEDSEAAPLRVGQPVVVLDMKDGTATVSPVAPKLLDD